MSGPAISLADERGVTMVEMLMVLLILGIVLAGMTILFGSASRSQVDQSKRVEAQQNARLALDRLRREIHCASAVSTPIAVPPFSLTITLPGYCQKPAVAGSALFTWCAPGAGPTWALWRYAGASCSGTGRKMAGSLISNSIFTYNRATVGPAQTMTSPLPNGVGPAFKPGTYTYDVTAVLASGLEVSGTPKSVTIPSGTFNKITVSWTTPPAGTVSFNVYGRDNNTAAGLRKLATNLPAASTSWDDDYSVPVNGTLASPPLATVGVSLAVDASPADTKQRFRLSDDIVLRNSGRR